MYIYVPVVFCFYNEHEHSFGVVLKCPFRSPVLLKGKFINYLAFQFIHIYNISI